MPSDKYYFENSMNILQCIDNQPKSIKEISSETGYHFSNVYRIIGVLEEHNLLISSGDFIPHGKYRRFKSRFDLESAEKKLWHIFPLWNQIES